MGKVFQHYYPSGKTIYCCAYCHAHLTLQDELISKAFHGRYGRAFLFEKCFNVYKGDTEERMLTTGMHTVCDIYCMICNKNIGWYYFHAVAESQKYKVGKFIVEKANMKKIVLKQHV